MTLRSKGLLPSPLGASILLHTLVLASIAWLGPVTGAALMPPKLVIVEVVTAEPTPPPTPVKPVARTIAAVKHALVANHSSKRQPTPAPPEPTPPAPAPPAKPEVPAAPRPETAATPNPQQPSAGTETLGGGDVSLGRSGSGAPGGRPGENLAAAGPGASALGGDGTGSLTSFAVPKGGYQMKPTYPESARRAGIEGTSLLRFEITEGGAVSKITVEKSAGHEELDRAAMAAVRQWRFDPARRGARAVAVWVTLPVRFELKH